MEDGTLNGNWRRLLDTGYKWFLFLGESFNYSSKIVSLATKVIVNQIVFTPVFNSYFFGAQSLLSGDSPAAAWDRIKRTVPTSFVNSCKLWPAVTVFSFIFVDPQYRSVFAGVIVIGWQTYLSFLNQKTVKERDSEGAGTLFAAVSQEQGELSLTSVKA